MAVTAVLEYADALSAGELAPRHALLAGPVRETGPAVRDCAGRAVEAHSIVEVPGRADTVRSVYPVPLALDAVLGEVQALRAPVVAGEAVVRHGLRVVVLRAGAGRRVQANPRADRTVRGRPKALKALR